MSKPINVIYRHCICICFITPHNHKSKYDRFATQTIIRLMIVFSIVVADGLVDHRYVCTQIFLISQHLGFDGVYTFQCYPGQNQIFKHTKHPIVLHKGRNCLSNNRSPILRFQIALCPLTSRIDDDCRPLILGGMRTSRREIVEHRGGRLCDWRHCC